MCIHGDAKQRSQATQETVTLPVTILNHLAAYVTSYFFYILCSCCNVTGRTGEENQETAAGFGILAVTSLYPLFFGLSQGVWGPVVATVFYFVNYHLYNSMLFRMSMREFLIDCITGNLFAVSELLEENDDGAPATDNTQGGKFDEENPPGSTKSATAEQDEDSKDDSFDA
jgi:TRAP-type uncharacterized transport system fused permease subunit